MDSYPFSPEDLRQLASRGLSPERAQEHLRLLRQGQAFAALQRPCTVGDGILRWTEAERLSHAEAWREAAEAGRAMQFVPASGAATRMFKAELAVLNRADSPTLHRLEGEAAAGSADAREIVEVLSNLDVLPFREDLAAALAARGLDLDFLLREGEARPVLEALLRPEGLDYARRPKALIPFHRYEDGPRLALEEHLAEAVELIRDAAGECRLHFTVPGDSRAAFETAAARAAERFREAGIRFRIGFSVQDPATDTLAADPEGRPIREADGSLLLRPGGHGALLGNLEACGGDLVFIKNVDNVVPDAVRAPWTAWRKAMGGYLVALQSRASDHLAALRALPDGSRGQEALEAAARFVQGSLGATLPPAAYGVAEERSARRDLLIALLDRPMRVCAVVEDRGEPGGGPYWTRHPDGSLRLQIVEAPQIDRRDPEQARIASAATHFSPTDMICALRDAAGVPYRLRDRVDASAGFVTEKSKDGAPLRALELPGLWNGSMADWSTAFVETPVESFNPVKTVADLLRPAHRAAPAPA